LILFNGEKVDDNLRSVNSYGIVANSAITVKDIGSQVLWKTVFYVEYLGPILVAGICYLLGKSDNYTYTQKVGFALFLVHYIKRELETMTIHVFSRDTMPVKRIFINSFHYWILCGLFIGLEFFHFWKDVGYSNSTVQILSVFFLIFEFLNLMCHITLKNLRSG